MNIEPFDLTPAPRLPAFLVRLAIAGALVLAAGIIVSPARAWPNLLVAAYFVLGLALAGAVFVAIQYASGAAWSVGFRRIPEAMAALVPVAGAVLGLLLALHPSFYSWRGHLETASAFKRAWLSWPFFLSRALVYVSLWSLFIAAILRHSRRQDVDLRPQHTRSNIRWSIAFLVIFGVTYWLASYDWIMSLEPQWASTIFGIYNFAGLFSSGIAALIIILVVLSRRGPLRGVVREPHLHDLGTLLFAFSTFWMYIWFSQYMLIWYANIPEETSYFIVRQRGAWVPLFVANVALNWIIPFAVLLHRGVKRNAVVLARVAAVILVGRWLDVYLMVVPAAGLPARLTPYDVAAPLLAGTLFALGLSGALRTARLLPVADPRLQESLNHH